MWLKKVTREAVRLKARNELYLPATRNLRVRGLKVREFTIISNNCWGGTVYESYGLPKQSPTVGMFVMPRDFIRLCSDIERYLSLPLEFVTPEESKYVDTLSSDSRWGSYLVGKLGDVELEMLHHHDEAEARAKWERRVRRVRWDRLIFKLNDQNGAGERDFETFDALPLEHKVIFAAKVHPGVACCKRIHCPSKCEFVPASYEPFGRNLSFDTTYYINSCFAEG